MDNIVPAAAGAAPKSAPAVTEPGFEESPDFIQSLARGLEVIRAFDRDHCAMSLSDLSEQTGLSRAAVRRILLTLQHLGYVGVHGRQFYLTPRILELGFRYLSSQDFTELALPYMEALSHTINESCSISVLDGEDIVYVQRVPVRKVMSITLNIGARLPAFCSSMGRVLLAAQPDEAQTRWLARYPREARTPHTLTDINALRSELLRVREQGFAYVEQELELGLCSIAVPLRNSRGAVIAGLNVGMAFREGVRERVFGSVLPALKRCAQQIENSALPGTVRLRS